MKQSFLFFAIALISFTAAAQQTDKNTYWQVKVDFLEAGGFKKGGERSVTAFQFGNPFFKRVKAMPGCHRNFAASFLTKKIIISMKNFAFMLLAFFSLSLVSCDKDHDNTPAEKTDDVVEIAIRQVKTGQLSAFEQARTNFINLLTKEPGVFNDREYQSFLHYNPAQDTSRAVYVGMTQYEDLAAFEATGQKLGNSTEAMAFFNTFDALTYTVLKPVKAGTVVDLTKVASSGQVLEIAVRDLSKYTNFNKSDYEAKRDAFLAELAKQPARVAEFQWVSALDPNIVVGMTVYTNQQAFFQLLSAPAFVSNPAVGAFLGTYPPTNFGEVCTVVK